MNWKDRIRAAEGHVDGGFYTTNLAHIFYLTGLQLSRGALFLQEGSSVVFVDSRYTQYAKKHSPLPIRGLGEEEKAYLSDVKQFYFDPLDSSYQEGTTLQKGGNAKPWTSINPIMRVRMQKDPSEVRLIRKSCLLLHKAYEHIRKKVRLGITEEQLAIEFEVYARKNGADKLAFEPIIAFGGNGAMPHHRSGKTKLKQNMPILMDLGVQVQGYASDMTRCFFYGMVSEKIQTLYTTVEKAQDTARSQLKIGTPLRAVDQAVRDVFAEHGVEDLYLHALGHGVGLEVHEPPIVSAIRSNDDAVLVENMVLAIEPGLYLPKIGGIRLEEMYLITKDGPKKLTV